MLSADTIRIIEELNKKLDTSTNDVKQGEIAKAGEAEKGDK